MKHIHTFESFLNEAALNEKTVERGDFLYMSDFDEFLAKLEELWGKKKMKWKVTKNGKEVSTSTKFTEKDDVNFAIGNLGIGGWNPNRPNTPSKLPPGAVNIKTGMSFSDLVYPSGSRMD